MPGGKRWHTLWRRPPGKRTCRFQKNALEKKSVSLDPVVCRRSQFKSIEMPAGFHHEGLAMTYKDFYAQALLSSLAIAYAVEKDLVQGREPTPENVALGASQLAMALTELLANTLESVPRGNAQF
jgi:hypothetical protein